MQLKEYDKHCTLRFDNGISVDILKSGKDFGGLGKVKAGRRVLRSDEMPIMPELSTVDGYRAARLQVDRMNKTKDGLTIELTPYMVRAERTDWSGGDDEPVLNVGPWAEGEQRDRGGSLRMEIKPVQRTLGGREYAGFSYGYKFRSRKYHAWRLHDRGTWELGGYATHNTFWMHGQSDEPCKAIQNKGDSYSSGVWWPDSGEFYQFLPLFTALQGFTFQFDPHGLLVTAFEEPFHCRSLFQKSPNENCLVHWHQLCDDMSGSLDFPALQVLYVADDKSTDLDRVNHYCAIREELQRSFCQDWGLEREKTVPVGILRGGARARSHSTRVALDGLVKAGCERVYVWRLFEGLGPTGVSSADTAAALARVVDFAADVHHRGMELAVPLAESCTPWLVEALAEIGEGAPRRTDVKLTDAFHEARSVDFYHHMDALRRHIGVGALYCDGPFCGAGQEFERNYPDPAALGQDGDPRYSENCGNVRSLQLPFIQMVGKLQRLGYTCPIIGTGAMSGLARHVSYDALKDCEHLFRDAVVVLPYDEVGTRKGALPHAYFRGCAHRVSYAVPCDLREAMRGGMATWWDPDMAAMNHAWQAVREHMEDSVVLAKDRGVLWTGPDPDVRVLWPFRKFNWTVGEEADVFDVMSHQPVQMEKGVLGVEPWKVYLVQNALDL